MSEEEKEAIEMLEKFITEHKLFNIKQSDGLELNIEIVLSLIDKQQKEIEVLKKDVEFWKEQADGYSGLVQQFKAGEVLL